jgi:hypothetical protein
MSCSVSGVVVSASPGRKRTDGLHQHVRRPNLAGDPVDEAFRRGGIGGVVHLGADTAAEVTQPTLTPVDRHQAAERALALAEPDRLVLPFAVTGSRAARGAAAA